MDLFWISYDNINYYKNNQYNSLFGEENNIVIH